MEIVFRCTGCGKKLITEESGQGLIADCPACGAAVTIPVPIAKAPSTKRIVRVPKGAGANAQPDTTGVTPPGVDANPATEPETAASPVSVTLFPERPHNLEIVVGWICVVVGTILALLLPKTPLLYLTFFAGAFLMSCVLFVRRKFLHWGVLLLCTCIPPPLLMKQNIWKSAASSAPAVVTEAPARHEASAKPTRTQKVVIDAQGEIKIVPVEAPSPGASSKLQEEPRRAVAGNNAPQDPFAETVKQVREAPPRHEPTILAAEDPYAELLENQNDVPPLVPEDVLASTRVGCGPDFVWQKPSAVDTIVPGQPAPVMQVPLRVYEDEGFKETFSPTGLMGNQKELQFDLGWRTEPYAGETCIHVRYDDDEDWVTVAWQHPGHNWGNVPGGLDLSNAKKLTFWAKGESGTEKVEFMIGMEQGQNAVSRDTLRATTGVICLEKEWKQYEIPIEELDRSRLITGFLFRIEGQGRRITFYLDNIQYE